MYGLYLDCVDSVRPVYGLVALSRNSFGWALMAALATNADLWSLLTHHQVPFIVHPQVWVIPFALIKPVYEAVKATVTGNASTLQVKRDKVFKRFYSMGVNQDRILRVLGKENAESVDLEDIALLIGLGTAIKDKELTIEQAFSTDDDEETPARSPLKERLAARRAARHPEKEND